MLCRLSTNPIARAGGRLSGRVGQTTILLDVELTDHSEMVAVD
jgi:hypothetical protein